jgi:hypothetical protein
VTGVANGPGPGTLWPWRAVAERLGAGPEANGGQR